MRTNLASLPLILALLAPLGAAAEPIDLLSSWEGTIDYFIIGAPLAADGTDSDTTRVDHLDQPASVDVTGTDIPAIATVLAAYLYWGGTIADRSDCSTTDAIDDEVVLTVPGSAATTVTADECYCEGGDGVSSYDIQACRKEITSLLTSGLIGTYTVDEFAARAANGSTDNASFAVVLVFEDANTLSPRRVALYDGLEVLYEGTRTMNLTGLDVDNPADGDIAWYVLDGDVGGTGPESVELSGTPGGASTTVYDAVNPATNPMNRTINTTSPPLTDVIGTDVDKLDASAGLTPGDTSVVMTYTAGGDKYWVVVNVVGINVYRSHIADSLSHKTWTLHVDADSSSSITPGDTIRYTIHLMNVGTAPAEVDLTDDIPSAFDSWTLIDAAGGTDASTATQLIVDDIPIAIGATADVIFDAVIAEGTLGETVLNIVDFDCGADGNSGSIASPSFVVGDEISDETPEPVTEPEPDIVMDPTPDPITDPTTDAPTDPATDGPDWSGESSRGCGCSVAGDSGAAHVLLLLALLLVRRRARQPSRP